MRKKRRMEDLSAARETNCLFRIIPDYAIVPLAAALIWNCLVYYGSHLIAGGWPHYMMDLPIDSKIPLIPWTASIYLGCYLFWIVNYILIARQSREEVYRFFSAEFLAKSICLLCFLIFPTTCVRPDVQPDDFWNWVICLVYQVDAPVNLFPSIHCLVSWMCYLGVRKQKNIPRWYRIFSFCCAAAVFVSTLTTKQHLVADVAGGIALAGLCCWIAEPIGFTKWYVRLIHWMERGFHKREKTV